MSDSNQHPPRDEELFTAYLDEELTPEERQRFEARLESDPEFDRAFQTYRRTVDLLRNIGPAAAPDSLLPGVQRRLSARLTSRDDVGPNIRFPYELLVFVAMLAGILYLYFGMVPAPPGPVVTRDKPVLIEVELSRPLPADLVQRFALVDPGTGEPGQTVYYVRLENEPAHALLTAIADYTPDPPRLSDKTPEFSLLLVHDSR